MRWKKKKVKVSIEKLEQYKIVAKIVNINLTMSIITLNVNILNTSIKRKRLSEYIKKSQLHVVFKKTNDQHHMELVKEYQNPKKLYIMKYEL